MTNEKMFDEIGCPEELKKCQSEIERHKLYIIKLISTTILQFCLGFNLKFRPLSLIQVRAYGQTSGKVFALIHSNML